MEIIVLGLNHKTAPIEVREKFSFSETKIKSALTELKDCLEIKEVFILSTCNRVEIYSLANDATKGIGRVEDFLVKSQGINKDLFRPHCYIYKGEEAVVHLFRVISSLDSMVVGEPQIMGQVKDAFDYAQQAGTNSIVFNTLFKKAVEVGKRARNETDIAKNAVSISFAAVELAKKIFGNIAGKTALVIGAGEMSELTLRHLVNNGISNVLVSNRTYEKAVELAKSFNAQAVYFEDCFLKMKDVDIVITSTGAPHCIIKKDYAAKLIRERKHRPIFFIDIAVPRDIEADVNKIDDIYLYDIDDLKVVVEANLKERAKEIPKVELIIEKEKQSFFSWFNSLDMVPTIVSLKEKIEEIRGKELEKVFNKLESFNQKDKELIQALTKGMANKFLHLPITNLKEAANDGNDYTYVNALRYLFGLKEKD